MLYAYRDRRTKKRNFRSLWITRINAGARLHGMSYSQFMGKVKDKNIEFAAGASPTDTTADGGGPTLTGATDKTIKWSNTTKSWEVSEPLQQKGAFMQSSTHQAMVLG